MATSTYGTPYVQGSDLVSAYPTASSNLATRVDEVSYKRNGLNAQTGTTYTLVVGDAGKTITLSNASAVAVTLPQDSVATLPTGAVVSFYNLGAGTVTISQGAGATLNGGSITLAQYAVTSVIKLSANTYGQFDGAPTTGFAPVAPTSITNTGGTATFANNTLTFTSVSSVSANGLFTSTYDDYRIVVHLTGSSVNLATRMRTRLAGADDTGSNYYTSDYYIGTTGAAAGSTVGAAATSWEIFTATDLTDTNNHAFIDVATPLSGKRKNMLGMVHQQNPSQVGYGYNKYYNKIVTTNYDGLTLFTSTGTASGTLSVYGYRK